MLNHYTSSSILFAVICNLLSPVTMSTYERSSSEQFKRFLKTYQFGTWDHDTLWRFCWKEPFRSCFTYLLTYMFPLNLVLIFLLYGPSNLRWISTLRCCKRNLESQLSLTIFTWQICLYQWCLRFNRVTLSMI